MITSNKPENTNGKPDYLKLSRHPVGLVTDFDFYAIFSSLMVNTGGKLEWSWTTSDDLKHRFENLLSSSNRHWIIETSLMKNYAFTDGVVASNSTTDYH